VASITDIFYTCVLSRKWPASKREPAMAAKGASNIIGSGPFDGGTMYRTSYVPKEIAQRELCKPQVCEHSIFSRL